MNLINSIASFKAAETMAKVQYAVAAKVMQASRDQGQMAAELVSQAAENMQQIVSQMAADLGTHFDAYG